MTALLLILMVGFIGFALDLGRVFNRKVELEGVARVAALAAAGQLNGTSAGIDAARSVVRARLAKSTYQHMQSIEWNDAALSFSTTHDRDGSWLDVGSAKATPAQLYYAKVDTDGLDPQFGALRTVLVKVLSRHLQEVAIRGHAIAGRTDTNVIPLAVCAMAPTPAARRDNPGGAAMAELVEYGFRRGVSYDLMRLNPHGTQPVNFVIDPTLPPGHSSSSATDPSIVGAFVCPGRMWMPSLSGGTVKVSSPFPIGSLYRHLNARFDQYDGQACHPYGSPPDLNVRAYAYDVAGGVSWMNPSIGSAAAQPTTSRGRLETVADLPTWPGAAAGAYGPLWSFARAVKYAAFVPGSPEPTKGYATFKAADWGQLYPSGPSAVGYLAVTEPYWTLSGAAFASPSPARPGIRLRRALHVPLLACPVASGTAVNATVMAVGKFFMTVPATPSALYAEFAGVAPESALDGLVELFP